MQIAFAPAPCKFLPFLLVPDAADPKKTFDFLGFRLDRTVLRFGGETVPLTPKAIDTLYILVERAPDVVTKEEIISFVWPDTFVVESSLARNISVIRTALEERAGQGPFIETIPKRGYRFVAPLGSPAGPDSPAIPAPVPVRTPWWVGSIGLAVLLTIALAFWRGETTAPPHPSALVAWRLLEQATPAEAQRAVTRFEEAIAIQPRTSSLRAGLADTLLALPALGVGDRRYFVRAKAEAATALRLDPKQAAAHASMAAAQLATDWDFAAAEQSLRQARQLDPRCLTALLYQVRLLSYCRRFDEAMTVAEEAVKADPVSALVGIQPGLVLYKQQRFLEAEPVFRSVLERERNFALAHYYLALSLAFLNRYPEALDHLAKAELQPGLLRTDRAWLKLRQGDRTEAEAVFTELNAQARQGRLAPSSPLVLAVALGRWDDAFWAIDAGIAAKEADLLALASDPRLVPLTQDPRYEAALRRIGLPSTKQPPSPAPR